MTARQYRSTVENQQLESGINDTVGSMTLNSTSFHPGTLPQSYPYTLVIDPDTTNEEIVTVVSGVGSTFSIIRGEDSTEAVEHSNGAVIKHMVTARDLQEPQDHLWATSGEHGITGSFVGDTDAQELSNKTINSNNNTLVIAQSSITGLASSLAAKDTALANHEADTTNIHGIADTSALATKTYADSSVSTHNSSTTLVHGIADTANLVLNNDNRLLPVGMLAPFAGATAPSGWLLCQGQEVLISSYSALKDLIGTTYGSLTNGSGATGTTHFRLPDLRGRVAIGAGAGTGLTSRTLAQTVGAETLPAHTHSIDHGHTGSGSTSISGGSHTHDLAGSTTNGNDHDHGTGDSNPGYGETAAQGIGQSNAATGATTLNAAAKSATHSHTASTSVTVDSMTGNSGSTGTGAHGVMQPSLVLNYIIKY